MSDAENKKEPLLEPAIYTNEPHACPYLSGPMAREEFMIWNRLHPVLYGALMEFGYRRSGRVVYRAVCEACRECIPLRVPVAAFSPSRSQRRVRRRNRDVSVEIGEPTCTDEKWRLYTAYLRYQHDGTLSKRREDFEAFLYDSPTETLEMVFRAKGRIVGVGIVDVCPLCLSSVYFYFDPAEARRSLGTYSALIEIETCRERGRPYWYAGFFVRQSARMNYKAHFRPHELLGPDLVWRPNP